MAGRRFILLLAALTALLYACLVGGMSYWVGSPFGAGKPLDLYVAGYSPEQARAFLDGLGAEGHAAYFGILGLLDTAFPIAFGTLLAAVLWQRAGRGYALLGVIYVVADLTENAVIRSLPEAADFEARAQLASHLTQTKFASLALCAAVFVMVMIREKRKG